jgi:hypothetical protein
MVKQKIKYAVKIKRKDWILLSSLVFSRKIHCSDMVYALLQKLRSYASVQWYNEWSYTIRKDRKHISIYLLVLSHLENFCMTTAFHYEEGVALAA